MESLYLLIPLSALLVLVILGVFGWAVHQGQFEDVDAEGERILTADSHLLDTGQAPAERAQQESNTRSSEGAVKWHK
jgi:cbb3-type cytochrome oxidase maturation protein